MDRLMLILVICGLVGVWPAAGQIPAGYEIVQVTLNSYYEAKPRMNNHGQIVFARWFDASSPSTAEVFLYDNGDLIRLTDDSVYDGLPDINDDGTIVWARGMGPIHPSNGEPSLEIVMYRNAEITRLTNNALQDIGPTINNAGHAVWCRYHEVYACGGPLKDIFMFDGKRVIQITTDAIPDQVENQSPEINDFGEIVWTRYDFCDPLPGHIFESKIMMYSGGIISELTAGQFAPQAPYINNRGQVVWDYPDTTTGEYVIELWETGVTTTFVGDALNGVINDAGDLAFQRWNEAAGAWNVWLYRSGCLYQVTDDDRDDNVPVINDGAEMAWGSGGYPESDIHYLRRIPPNDLQFRARFNRAENPAFFDGLRP